MVNWLRQMAHDQEVVGSNPGTVYVQMQAIFSLLHYKKMKIQVAKWGTPKKYLKKKIIIKIIIIIIITLFV
jgi:hypothetical protein